MTSRYEPPLSPLPAEASAGEPDRTRTSIGLAILCAAWLAWLVARGHGWPAGVPALVAAGLYVATLAVTWRLRGASLWIPFGVRLLCLLTLAALLSTAWEASGALSRQLGALSWPRWMLVEAGRSALVAALFCGPLAALYRTATWLPCVLVAIGLAGTRSAALFDATSPAAARLALIVDLAFLAAAVPVVAAWLFDRLPGVLPRAQARLLPGARGGAADAGKSLAAEPATPGQLRHLLARSDWVADDRRSFDYLCRTAVPRLGAVGPQLLEDIKSPVVLALVPGGAALAAIGWWRRDAASALFGLAMLALYARMLAVAVRELVRAPIVLGTVDAIDEPHPIMRRASLARARTAEGTLVPVVLDAAAKALLERQGPIGVALLATHAPYARAIGSWSAKADDAAAR